jgi:hypothetical protein
MEQDYFLAIFSLKNQEFFIFITFFKLFLPLAIYIYKFYSFSLIAYLAIFQKKKKNFKYNTK